MHAVHSIHYAVHCIHSVNVMGHSPVYISPTWEMLYTTSTRLMWLTSCLTWWFQWIRIVEIVLISYRWNVINVSRSELSILFIPLLFYCFWLYISKLALCLHEKRPILIFISRIDGYISVVSITSINFMNKQYLLPLLFSKFLRK